MNAKYIEGLEKMKTVARKLDLEGLVEAVLLIGGSVDVTQEQRLTRAILIDVYEERTSEEDADLLMGLIGL